MKIADSLGTNCISFSKQNYADYLSKSFLCPKNRVLLESQCARVLWAKLKLKFINETIQDKLVFSKVEFSCAVEMSLAFDCVLRDLFKRPIQTSEVFKRFLLREESVFLKIFSRTSLILKFKEFFI